MIALIGTPCGSSANFESAGLFVVGAVKRRVRVRGLLGRALLPGVALPVGELGGDRAVLALPPHVAVRRARDVGEDACPCMIVFIAFGFDS